MIQNDALSLIDSRIDFQIKPILKGISSLCRQFRRTICIVTLDFDVMCVNMCMIYEVKGKGILSFSEIVHFADRTVFCNLKICETTLNWCIKHNG